MHVLLTAILLAQSVSGAPPASIYGAYQDCTIACRTIQVRRDYTFTYRLSGDLYNDERHVGGWTWLGGNRIRAVIPPDTSTPSVVETTVVTDTDFHVSVVDPQGAVFPGATITPLYPEPGAISATSNNDGSATIPRCPEFEIRVLSYIGRYRPKDDASTRFEVVLSIEQMTRFAIDEVWEVSDGQLFILDDDGTRRSTDGLPKISKRKERAIFGTTASN